MNFRQTEFCRLFAAGQPAAKAAIGAGYAKATAERNAASFLSHPAIAARIARLRCRRNIVTPQDLHTAKAKVMHILATSHEAGVLLKASHELCRLAKMQQKVEIQPEAWAEGEVEEQELERGRMELDIQELEEMQEQARAAGDQQALHKIEALLTDSHGLKVDKSYAHTPRQFDRLPSGKPAFDAPLPARAPARTPARTPATASGIRQAFRLLAQRQMRRPRPHPQPLPMAG